MPEEYFCILAGGGVRGTAYLGVLKSLEEMDIKISGIAGSSVGAIFASLYAVGYSCQELQDVIFNTSYLLFRDLTIPSGREFGFCKGDNLYGRIKELIERKYYGENYSKSCEPVTFSKINKDLEIIATNISRTTFREFSRNATPDVEVAYAVRTSISIPGFFKPVWEDDNCLVDVDIINNFPTWLFKDNLIAKTNSRILEFRLEGERENKKINNLMDYFSAILDTSYNISTDILIDSYGKNDQYDIIKIDTGGIQVIDFGISETEKHKLVENGYNCTKSYFEGDLVKKKEHIIKIYQEISNKLKSIKNEISKDKTKDSTASFGELAMFITDNKAIISARIYSRLTEIIKLYRDNLTSVKFFNIKYLKDKHVILPKLERMVRHLDHRIEDICSYAWISCEDKNTA